VTPGPRDTVTGLRILVLGASGRTGRQVVEQALGHGHTVTAFVRDPARLDLTSERLRVVTGDVTRSADVQAAVDGQDAVISVVGSKGERPVHVYSDGVANAIRAMTARGVRRLVVLSAVGVGTDGSGLPFAQRALRTLPAMRAMCEDMERMEGDVMLTDLDWTIVRASSLTDGPFTGVYRVVEGPSAPKGTQLSRPDAAALLLKCAEGELYLRRAVAAAY
jgi:putative NADH-flavin reductase